MSRRWLIFACVLPMLAFLAVLPVLGLLRGALDNYESESKQRILDVNGHLLVLAYSRSYDWRPAESALSASPGVVQVERFIIDSTLVASGGHNHQMLLNTFDASNSQGRERIARYLTAGALPRAGAARPEVLLGRSAAEQLQVKVGDSVHVLAPPAWARRAQQTGDVFEAVVVGIFGYDYSQYDDKLALLPFEDAVKLGGSTTGVRGWSQDPELAEAETDGLSKKLGNTASVLGWRKLNAGLFEALASQRRTAETPSKLGLALVTFTVLLPAVALAWACLRRRQLRRPWLLAAGLALASLLPGSLVTWAAAAHIVPIRTGEAYFGVVLRELSVWPTLSTAAWMGAVAVVLGGGLSVVLAFAATRVWWPLLLTPVLLAAAAGVGTLLGVAGLSRQLFDGFVNDVRARESKIGVDLVVSGVPPEQARAAALRISGVKAALVRHHGSALAVRLGANADVTFDALAPADARAQRPWLDWDELERRAADTTGAEAVGDDAQAWEQLVDRVHGTPGDAATPDVAAAPASSRPIVVLAGNGFGNGLQIVRGEWFQIKVIERDGKVRTTPARLVDSFSIGLDQADSKTLFALHADADEALGATRETDLVLKLAADAAPAQVASELQRQLGPAARVTESWAAIERALRFEAGVTQWSGAAISIALWLSLALLFALLGWQHDQESRRVRRWRVGLAAGLALATAGAAWFALTASGALLARWAATAHVQLPGGLAPGFVGAQQVGLQLAQLALFTALAALPGLALATRPNDSTP